MQVVVFSATSASFATPLKSTAESQRTQRKEKFIENKKDLGLRVSEATGEIFNMARRVRRRKRSNIWDE
jgi:CHASE3 domain sensor protein